MAIKAVLFDLDGTLLPMDQGEFLKLYFGEMAKKMAPMGYDPKALIDAIWQSTGAMIGNDGSKPNGQAFWDHFKTMITTMPPEEIDANIPRFDAFYLDPNGFHKARVTSGENPLAAAVIEAA